MSPRALPSALLAFALPATANTLGLGDAAAPPGRSISVPVEITPTAPVVGVQFIVRYPPALASVSLPGITPAETPSDHATRSTSDGQGARRVVVFSPTNQPVPAGISITLPVTLSGTAPQGGPSLDITDIIFTDAVGNTYPAATGYTVAELWRRENFTPAERDDPLVIGDDRDPDGDGASNIAELAAGTAPRDPASAPVLQLTGNAATLGLRFSRSPEAATRAAVSVFAESSPDLQAWTTTGVTETPTGTPGEIEATVPVTGEKRFLRITTRRN